MMENHSAMLQESNIAAIAGSSRNMAAPRPGTIYGQDCGPWRSKERQGGGTPWGIPSGPSRWVNRRGNAAGSPWWFRTLNGQVKCEMVADGEGWLILSSCSSHHSEIHRDTCSALTWGEWISGENAQGTSRHNAAALLRNGLMIRNIVIPFLSYLALSKDEGFTPTLQCQWKLWTPSQLSSELSLFVFQCDFCFYCISKWHGHFFGGKGPECFFFVPRWTKPLPCPALRLWTWPSAPSQCRRVNQLTWDDRDIKPAPSTW